MAAIEMPIIKTKIDRRSSDFRQNAKANAELAEDLRGLSEQINTGGAERSRERHLARGKLLPRRMSGVSPTQQRQLARAIKRARMIALMPYAAND